MRSRVALVMVYCACAVSSSSALGVADHLVPFERRDLEANVHGYWSLLRERLFVTAADYGRVLVLPSAAGTGEYAISIYTHSATKAPYVTYTRAARNLWYQRAYQGKGSSASDPYASSEPIQIARIDAAIPKSAALALRMVWTEMLRRTAPHVAGSGSPVVVDGTDMVFFAARDSALMPPYATGKNISRLSSIVHMLQQYCENGSSHRGQLSTTIAKHAQAFANDLQRHEYKRPNQAMQRTAGRSAFQLSMTSTFTLQPDAPSPAVADLLSR